jgi:hypothetical protein
MATTRVDFTEWLPDQPGVVGALTNAKNVYPKAVGYGAFPLEEDYSAAASEGLNSVFAGKDDGGTTKVFAGGSTKIFLLDASDMSLDDVSGATYSAGSDWKFIQFGSYVIAGNNANKLQYADLSTTISFADLNASAPTAKLLTVVRDFVVTGNTDTASNELRWSGINNPTGTWGSVAVTQADFQTIPDGGEIRGLTGGEFGLVLLERSIVRMSYVGSPLIFQFDNISRNLGCYESNSVAQWQGVTYFLADDGFYACNGQQVDPIGAEKVNRHFWETALESKIGEMSTAVDPFRNLIIWGYQSTDLTYRLLIYHLITKKWSFADTGISRIANLFTPAFTLEQLDNFSASLDALPVSLDDRQWLGGKFLFGGISTNKIITFSGPSKEARITTSDLETNGTKSMVTLAKPIVDGGSASVAVASRQNLAEDVVFNTAVAADSENRVGLRSLGRYHRLRVIPSGNWLTAIGVEMEIQPAGMR